MEIKSLFKATAVAALLASATAAFAGPTATLRITGTTAPKEASVFTFDIKATPALSSELSGITDTANLDGNATINFEYL